MGKNSERGRGATTARGEMTFEFNKTSSPSVYAAVSLERVVTTRSPFDDLVRLGWTFQGCCRGERGCTGAVTPRFS
jgi:hypothetical protein